MFDVWRDGEVSALICQGRRLVSDACVATHARSTGVGRLAGRPGPHGRRGLQTADAAYGTSRSGSRGEVFPYGLA